MSKTLSALGERVWEMPPLILHLFNQRVPADSLLENSRCRTDVIGVNTQRRLRPRRTSPPHPRWTPGRDPQLVFSRQGYLPLDGPVAWSPSAAFRSSTRRAAAPRASPVC